MNRRRGKPSASDSGFHNPFTQTRYVLNAHRLNQLPPDQGFEVAFAGRSNAGKSSAINALTGRNSLARVSKTPGRTQQIVIFELDENRRLADLPGYGYAKVPDALRQHWRTTMQAYFETRRCLAGVILLMDIRHPLKPYDEQMLAWCETFQVPCRVLLTKADKLKRGPGRNALLSVERCLPRNASVQRFSAKTRTGVVPLIELLQQWLEMD